MSIKTLRKRMSLVAVSALGVGLLSVAPASAANFAADDLDIVATDVATSTNIGACSIATGGQSAVFVSGYTVTLDSATTDSYYFVVAGPARVVSTEGETATPTTISDSDGTVADTHVLALTGTGTVTVTGYTAVGTAAVDIVTISVVASCEANTLSVADSNFTIVSSDETDTDLAAATAWATDYDGLDTTGANLVTAGSQGYARAILSNAYAGELPAKAIVVSGSAGCLVAVANTDGTAGAGTPSASTAVLAANTGADLTIAVATATAGAAQDCTVTLTWNGLPVGTKTFAMLGAPASVTVSDVTIGEKDGVGYFRASVKDSLGRALPGVAVGYSSTNATNVASYQVVSSITGKTTAAATNVATGAIRGTTPAAASGDAMSYTCTSKGGPAKLVVRALVSGLTYVSSSPFDVYCGANSIDTWTVSLDKAQYAPGEIATLTVSAKDVDGHMAASTLALTGLVQSFPGLSPVTTPNAADKFSSGAGFRTYTYSVGTTEGSFVGSFKLTGTTDATAKTIQYKIVAPTSGVTNAEVLAAIVKLIASINKQIAKLQKLIKK